MFNFHSKKKKKAEKREREIENAKTERCLYVNFTERIEESESSLNLERSMKENFPPIKTERRNNNPVIKPVGTQDQEFLARKYRENKSKQLEKDMVRSNTAIFSVTENNTKVTKESARNIGKVISHYDKHNSCAVGLRHKDELLCHRALNERRMEKQKNIRKKKEKENEIENERRHKRETERRKPIEFVPREGEFEIPRQEETNVPVQSFNVVEAVVATAIFLTTGTIPFNEDSI